ncbi:MAG: DNA polymerase I [Clostridia bacterium BRH_c25]|nr:MAG: DNA polymerase I [Clostridia bacterium BRH_c25]
MESGKFIIIDGNSLMHRAFYALPKLTNSKGFHTSVIYGFVNMINKILEEYKPQYIGIAFDRKAPTFRHLEYAEYKAGRHKMAEEMAEQIPVLKEVLVAMNIKQSEIDGFEADDIIGTVAAKCDEKGISTLIVTGDKDAFQLISDNVHTLMTKKGISEIEEYDIAKLRETYGIAPAQITDLKGLMGDASDNIPGVPGVGEKTALELIQQFGTVEDVLQNVAEIKKNKVRENVSNNMEQAIFSKKLATIVKDAPIDFNLEDYSLKEADKEKLYELLTELEFKALVEKMCGNLPNAVAAEPIKIIVEEISSIDKLKEVLEEAEKSGRLAFKIDDEMGEMLRTVYIDVAGKQYRFAVNDSSMRLVKSIMEDPEVKKSGHDIKQDILLLRKYDIEVNSIGFDTMVAAYLLNPSKGSYKIRDLSQEYLGAGMDGYDSKGVDQVQRYGATVKKVSELQPVFTGKLEEYGMMELYYTIELPLVAVLADMEYEGFNVDKEILQVLSADFAGQIEALTADIYRQSGEEFNINSTKQLGAILFDKLGLPVVKKTKTGYSTDVEVLEQLSAKHPIIEKLLEYRQLVKIKSTYVDGLIGIINPDTGKIHTKLNQTVTATGRLSSTEPNLQNIPIKTENGRQIRKVFVPKSEEYVLVDADYSQIELRILAHISGDQGLIDTFRRNEDIHRRTASEVFGVDLDEVTATMRGRAKAVNFGIVYGISDYGLSQDLKISRKEAKQYIDNYFARYPMVKQYMIDIVEAAKADGYVKTIMNRRRYIPEIASRNAVNRNFGERMAMNTPIQGSAADLIKMAMVKVYEELKKRNLRSRLILQVHDELIVETHKSELSEVKQLVEECMEKAIELKVPVIADISSGDNWYNAK